MSDAQDPLGGAAARIALLGERLSLTDSHKLNARPIPHLRGRFFFDQKEAKLNNTKTRLANVFGLTAGALALTALLIVAGCSSERAAFPDVELRLFGPDRDSGTFDYFTEEINGEEGLSRSDYSPSADDNVLVQGVSGTPYSLGYFGYSFYIQNQARLNLIEVDGGNGCVAPGLDTIGDGTYAPLARPLFIYVNAASLARAEVQDFVRFYVAQAAELSEAVGYVALPAADYAGESAKLEAAIGAAGAAPPASGGRITIQVDGSSTVQPITQRVAEDFRADGRTNIQIPIAVSGTGGGFERFTVGETEISNASRPIKEEEAAQAKANGIEFIEIKVAFDGIAVVTHPANDNVTCLTVEKLKEIWEPGSQINNWNQIIPVN